MSRTEDKTLLKKHTASRYKAINRHRDGSKHQLFYDAIYENDLVFLHMEADLKRAVKNVEWRLYYQPILSVRSGKIIGVEALIRWFHPKRGCIPPLEFIPVAEATGLILPIGEYVLNTACKQIKTWRDAGHQNLWVSVNISGRQFQEQNLPLLTCQALANNNLSSNSLRLEITESTAMQNIEHSITTLRDLNKLGIDTALDDFGIGYSSFGYLKRLPIQILKIDKSFMKDMRNEKNSEAIVAALISLGHTLGLKVVAEGVEQDEQFAYLNANFCDEVQGDLFCRALPDEELGNILIRINSFAMLKENC